MREPSAASTVLIRPATEDDLPAVLDIYNDAVLTSTASFDIQPRTMEAHRRWWLDHQHPFAVLVAEDAGQVTGWASISRFGTKPAYRFTVENSVYVHPEAHGRGLGTLLLARLLETARDNGFRTVIARITGGNDVSVRLHQRLGFRHVGVEREVGYKFGRWLDVIIMQRPLAE